MTYEVKRFGAMPGLMNAVVGIVQEDYKEFTAQWMNQAEESEGNH